MPSSFHSILSHSSFACYEKRSVPVISLVSSRRSAALTARFLHFDPALFIPAARGAYPYLDDSRRTPAYKLLSLRLHWRGGFDCVSPATILLRRCARCQDDKDAVVHGQQHRNQAALRSTFSRTKNKRRWVWEGYGHCIWDESDEAPPPCNSTSATSTNTGCSPPPPILPYRLLSIDIRIQTLKLLWPILCSDWPRSVACDVVEDYGGGDTYAAPSSTPTAQC
ncbi:hypothetical protein C8R45DRAFT_1089129 [Mycena sanguinolenta]|nr:hypothetical protein C8R45DRAFT_1089129 [Mycena sanguinolenta]